ncbi:hypothetical protein JR316_0009092 [Psilocybe cubensis]|uniref:Uncharacterized protein n=2 Tax=Psilocybe cubensis TaxID=181762 RepID=A0ACB8GT33_PSICU|nr:hypothetical protein JR316_0009092 [Psilocybe cubensis]KAH9478635.1 hypothetical protein JR316_0009092 [Psilocybe cubensis]
MDANSTVDSAPNVFPPPPVGLNYIAAIQPSLTFLMIGTVWGGILLPLLVALFFFSSKTTRRRPIFILNVFSITLGLFMSIFNAIHAILTPLRPLNPDTALVFTVVITFTPWLVELILVVRLLAVYPYARTPKRTWFAIFIPLILLKIARFVNNTVYAVEYVQLVRNPGSADPISVAQRSWDSHPGTKIEWVLQVVDNTATSLLFILRLKSGLEAPGREVATGNSRQSYASRIKALFWISVSNFVFPVILSIIQLIMLFRDPNFLKGSYIFLTNDYVEIVGVLLATVWASTSHWTDQNSSDISSKSYGGSTAPRFARHIRLNQSETFTNSTRGAGYTADDGHIEMKGMDPQSKIEIAPLESHLEFSEPSVKEKKSGIIKG